MSAYREHQFTESIKGLSSQHLTIREQQLQETEEQFQEVASQWLKKERQLQELASVIQIKEQQLQDKDRQLQSKDQELQERDRQLEVRAQQLEVRNQQLQEKEHLVLANEQLVRTTEQLIATKNQLLAAKELQLAEQEAQLQLNVQQLQSRDQKIQELDQQLQDIHQRLSAKQQHLDDLLNSRALRIGSILTWPVRRLRHSPLRSTRATRDSEEIAASIRLHNMPEGIVSEHGSDITLAKNEGTLVIGVVTFNNSPEQLARLLRSIELAVVNLEEANVKVKLFVIDNGRESSWPESSIQPRRFESQGNIGFGRGMNLLMAAAFAEEETEWYLCLNPDGALHHRALKELISSSKAHPDSLIEARQFPEEHVKPYDPQTLETPWATGACLLIRRRIFVSVGSFDPNIFMYLEDIDLSWRARSAGFSIVVSPKALFGHAVLHRKPDPDMDKSFLLSGRYLAFKWKNQEFYQWAERELVKRKHFSSCSDLPELDGLNTISTGIKPELSDFKHYFNFSKPRW